MNTPHRGNDGQVSPAAVLPPAFHEGMEHQPEQRDGAVNRSRPASPRRREWNAVSLCLTPFSQRARAALDYQSLPRRRCHSGRILERPPCVPWASPWRPAWQWALSDHSFPILESEICPTGSAVCQSSASIEYSALLMGEKLSVARNARRSLSPSMRETVNSTSGGVLSTSK